MGDANGRGDSLQGSSLFLKDMENKIKTLQKSYDALRQQVNFLQLLTRIWALFRINLSKKVTKKMTPTFIKLKKLVSRVSQRPLKLILSHFPIVNRNLSFDQSKAQNQPNFITSEDKLVDDVPKQRDVLLCNWRSPGRIPQQERIEIIQTRNEVPSEQREQDFKGKLRE